MGKTHGFTYGTPIQRKAYRAWQGLRDRCGNPNCEKWSRYGGRGITFDPAWSSFEQFLKDVGLPPTLKHSLDRFPDRNGPYAPHNVRWATAKEQAVNRDTVSIKGAGNGNAILSDQRAAELKRRVLAGEKGLDLAKEFGVSRSTVSRIKRGTMWEWL